VFEVDWDPSSFADLFAIFQHFSGQFRRILWLTFAAQSWALWLLRNSLPLRANFLDALLIVFSKLSCFCSFGVLFKSLKLSPSWMVWSRSLKRRSPV
jgi:hypothetical protein